MSAPRKCLQCRQLYKDGGENFCSVQCYDWHHHLREVAEAARVFAERQKAGMSIFEAAENLPIPRLNRAGARQSDLRELYQEEPPPPRKEGEPVMTVAARSGSA
jgi:hypothetical protein